MVAVHGELANAWSKSFVRLKDNVIVVLSEEADKGIIAGGKIRNDAGPLAVFCLFSLERSLKLIKAVFQLCVGGSGVCLALDVKFFDVVVFAVDIAH